MPTLLKPNTISDFESRTAPVVSKINVLIGATPSLNIIQDIYNLKIIVDPQIICQYPFHFFIIYNIHRYYWYAL